MLLLGHTFMVESFIIIIITIIMTMSLKAQMYSQSPLLHYQIMVSLANFTFIEQIRDKWTQE
jgi:hypothetical protein